MMILWITHTYNLIYVSMYINICMTKFMIWCTINESIVFNIIDWYKIINEQIKITKLEFYRPNYVKNCVDTYISLFYHINYPVYVILYANLQYL